MNTDPETAVIPFPSAEADPPAGKGGYELSRFNAVQHGILSRHTVLPHEDGVEYADLLTALTAEHQPGGATEMHLVEELAGCVWRKRRVLMAEGATIRRGLYDVARHKRWGRDSSPSVWTTWHATRRTLTESLSGRLPCCSS